MSLDSVFVGSKTQNLNASPKQTEYTGVIINTSDETYVSAGDISSANAHVLEVTADWATAADAQRILNSLRGFQYQPYEATGSFVDPAAELGDAITIGKVYSGIYSQGITFSALMASDVSAPQEEQIDNEYKYISPQKREYKRQFAEVRASIIVEADRITAEVTRATQAEGTLSTRITQTDNAITAEVTRATQAEGTLSTRITQTDNAITTEVLRATQAEGTLSSQITQTATTISAEVTRATQAEGVLASQIEQTAESITAEVSKKLDAEGGSSSFSWELTATGFAIKSNGSEVFKADSTGITVTGDGTFTGNVYAGNIQYGGDYGSFDGWGLTGGSVGTYPLTGGVTTSLGYGDFANEVFNFGTQAAFGNFNSCITQFLHTDSINVADRNLSLKQATVRNAAGTGTTTIFYLGYN